MKAAAFGYVAPDSVEEAVGLLEHPGARVLAGGQSLVPLMNMRVLSPDTLIDINRVPRLDHVDLYADRVVIGAIARQRRVELDPDIRRACPMVAEAAAAVGNVSVRNRGTVVGSIAHGEPAGEWPTVFVALDGICSVRGPRGERTITARDMFTGHGQTSLAPDELIVEISMQLPTGGSTWIELSRRVGDFPIVGVGAAIRSAPGGRIESCSIALGGVREIPIRATSVESALVGSTPTDADLDEVAHLAGEELDPPSNVHGSADFRRRVAVTLVGRALRAAYVRAERRIEA